MCILHVKSSINSFKEFIESTKLDVYQSHEKSDVIDIGPNKGKAYGYFGFSCNISTKEWIDFSGQI